ncbi:hypothetical protein WDU94_002928 [Cyamophila willieti]
MKLSNACFLFTLSVLFAQRTASERRSTEFNAFVELHKMHEAMVPTKAQQLYNQWYANLKAKQPTPSTLYPPTSPKILTKEEKEEMKRKKMEDHKKTVARELNDRYINECLGIKYTTPWR